MGRFETDARLVAIKNPDRPNDNQLFIEIFNHVHFLLRATFVSFSKILIEQKGKQMVTPEVGEPHEEFVTEIHIWGERNERRL